MIERTFFFFFFGGGGGSVLPLSNYYLIDNISQTNKKLPPSPQSKKRQKEKLHLSPQTTTIFLEIITSLVTGVGLNYKSLNMVL
jgi:hypothetical protein